MKQTTANTDNKELPKPQGNAELEDAQEGLPDRATNPIYDNIEKAKKKKKQREK